MCLGRLNFSLSKLKIRTTWVDKIVSVGAGHLVVYVKSIPEVTAVLLSLLAVLERHCRLTFENYSAFGTSARRAGDPNLLSAETPTAVGTFSRSGLGLFFPRTSSKKEISSSWSSSPLDPVMGALTVAGALLLSCGCSTYTHMSPYKSKGSINNALYCRYLDTF